jgi:hypothetical protein
MAWSVIKAASRSFELSRARPAGLTRRVLQLTRQITSSLVFPVTRGEGSGSVADLVSEQARPTIRNIISTEDIDDQAEDFAMIEDSNPDGLLCSGLGNLSVHRRFLDRMWILLVLNIGVRKRPNYKLLGG